MRLLDTAKPETKAALQSAMVAAVMRTDRRLRDRTARRERSKAERVETLCSRGAAGYTRDGWPIRPIQDRVRVSGR